jgi:hypothetical protein
MPKNIYKKWIFCCEIVFERRKDDLKKFEFKGMRELKFYWKFHFKFTTFFFASQEIFIKIVQTSAHRFLVFVFLLNWEFYVEKMKNCNLKQSYICTFKIEVSLHIFKH